MAAAGTLLACLWLAAPAGADDYVGGTPPEAGRVDTGGSGALPVEVASNPSSARAPVAQSRGSNASGLALSGGDVMGLLFLGALLVGTGTVMTRRSRSSRS